MPGHLTTWKIAHMFSENAIAEVLLLRNGSRYPYRLSGPRLDPGIFRESWLAD